jgi:hypothetical protein
MTSSRLLIDLSGRVPEHCEEMAASACENEQVPDEMAVAQALSPRATLSLTKACEAREVGLQ